MKENLAIFIIILLNIIILGLFKRELNIKSKLKKLFQNEEKIYFILLILSLFFFQYFIEKELNILDNNLLIKKINKYINSDRILSVYLGLVSFLLAIYIYCIGIQNSFKKYIIIYLIGEGTILYLSLLVLFMYFLGIPSICIISLLLLTFYELYKIIDLIFFISSQNRFSNEFDRIVYKFKEANSERGLKDLYYEIKKNIFLSLKDGDYVGFHEGLEFYTKLLKNGFSEEVKEEKLPILNRDLESEIKSENPVQYSGNAEYPKSKKIIEKVEEKEKNMSIEFIYYLYKNIKKYGDDEMYSSLENTTIKLSKYYLNKKDRLYAQLFCDFITERYSYMYITHKKLEFGFISEYIYLDDFDEEQKIIMFKSLLYLVNEIIKKDKKNDYDFVKKIFEKYLKDKIGLYVNIILLYLLEVNEKLKEWDPNFKKKFILIDIECLENLFVENQKYEQKFEIYKFDFLEPNILGECPYRDKKIKIKDILLELLNQNLRKMGEKFILENYEELEWRIEGKELKNIELKLSELKNKIQNIKAAKLSKVRLSPKEIKNYYLEIEKNKSVCNQFILENLCKNKEWIVVIKEKREKWEEEAKGYKVLFNNDIVLESTIGKQYINLLDEYFIIKACLNLARKLKYSKIDFKKNWCMFIHKNDYIRLDKSQISSQIKIYVLENYNELENPILIPMKSIDLILEFLPEEHTNNKNTYVEIETLENSEDIKLLNLIEGDNIENKKLILKGSSLLKIYKNIEIYFDDNIEVYTLINLPKKSNE